MTWITGPRKSQYTMILSVGDVWSGNIDVCILIGSSVKMTFYYMCYRRRDIYIILIPISHHKRNFFKNPIIKIDLVWYEYETSYEGWNVSGKLLRLHNTSKGPSFRFFAIVLFMVLSNQQIKLLIDYIYKNSLNWQSFFHF